MKIEYMGFLIQPVESMPTIYEIKFHGQGRLASALHGNFTNPSIAKNRIDSYLNGNNKKVVNNETGSKV